MRWLMVPILLLTAGCSSEWTRDRDYNTQLHNIYPANYRPEIVALMRTYLNDPTGVRDAFVSVPAQRNIDGANRYVSCVRYNARNSAGRYAGSKDSLVLFRGGRLDHVLDNDTARDQCRSATYEPFPELHQLSR